MATAPQFVTTPTPTSRATPATLTAANTATNGTGATGRALILVAGASGFTLLPSVIIKPLGTGVATLIRLFLNNGSDPETAGNNSLIHEEEIVASTLSQSVAMPVYTANLNLLLAGHASAPQRVYATLATAHAAGIRITPKNAGDSV